MRTEPISMCPEESILDGYKMTELGPLPEEWQVVPFEKAITGIVHVPKVKHSHYQTTGLVPVVNQGQSLIAGYVHDVAPYRGPLPIIVFGDHTRIFKFIDFPFVGGADGIQVLVPNSERFEPLFLFYSLLKLDIPSRDYNRYFSLLREKKHSLPPAPRAARHCACVAHGAAD